MCSLWCVQKERLGAMLDEDPALMEKRTNIAKRLELYKSARDEIDSVAWKWWSRITLHEAAHTRFDMTKYQIWTCIFFFLLEIRKTHRCCKSLDLNWTCTWFFHPFFFFIEHKLQLNVQSYDSFLTVIGSLHFFFHTFCDNQHLKWWIILYERNILKKFVQFQIYKLEVSKATKTESYIGTSHESIHQWSFATKWINPKL